LAFSSESAIDEAQVRLAVAKEREPIEALRKPLDEANNEYARFDTDVNSEAEVQYEKQESRIRWLTFAIYCLFSIGWTLGLIGRVLKLPALGGTVECILLTENRFARQQRRFSVQAGRQGSARMAEPLVFLG
jgi:hypothetical protein